MKALRTATTKKKPIIISSRDLVAIHPKTKRQEDVFHAYGEGQHLLLTGLPGTGKSFLALYLALSDILSDDSDYQKLIIVRSVVPVRDIGYLPGSEIEKVEVYESPYKMMCAELFANASEPARAYSKLKTTGYVEFMTTSFLRGNTFADCVVFLDEGQNGNGEELHSAITRVGENCRLIVAGDMSQTDLIYKRNDISGFPDFTRILDTMGEFAHIDFGVDDIVRSRFIKSYILARKRYEEKRG